MKKEGIITYLVIFLLLAGFLIFLYFAQGKITGFSVYEQSTQSGFDEGTYNNTNYNGSAVVLNSGQTSGNYLSKVFDATGSSTWNNLSWTSSAIGELPNNGATETKWGSGNINMVGNVLLLHLNETSGTLADGSGNSNSGTNFGGTYGAAGRFGTAMSFDGTDDRINIANNQTLNMSNAITIAAWVNMTSAGDVPRIVSKGFASSYELQVHLSVPRLVLTKGGTENFAKGTTNIVDNKFHYIVGAWDGTNMRLYVDGNLEKTTALTSPIDTKTTNLSIGARGGASLNFFPGSIDDVAIWNRSLSAQEITDIYKRGATRLNLSVQSCDDSACSGESFSDIGDDSPQTLNVANNRYFQYKFNLETDNSSYTSNLYNVKVDYTLNNAAPTWSNLADNETSTTPKKNDIIHMNVSLNDDTNLSNYIFSWNDSGSWVNDSAVVINTNQTTVSANKTVTASKNIVVSYRFYFNDSNGVNNQTDIGTFTIKNTFPTIPSQSFLSNNTITNDNTPFFNWSSSSDADGDAITYRIQLDNDADFSSPTNESTTSATNLTLSVLSDGTYYWRVRAETSDANSSYSVLRVFSVDTSVSSNGGGGGGGGRSKKSITSEQVLEEENIEEDSEPATEETEKEFIKILDVSTNNFQLGEVAKIKILVQNLQQNNISKSNANLDIYDSEFINIANLKSEDYEISELSNKELIVFWDTKNLKEGQYTSELKVNYNEEFSTKSLNIDISKNSMIFIGTGFAISDDSDKKFNIKNLLIIVIGILVFFLLYKIIKNKKRGTKNKRFF